MLKRFSQLRAVLFGWHRTPFRESKASDQRGFPRGKTLYRSHMAGDNATAVGRVRLADVAVMRAERVQPRNRRPRHGPSAM